MADLTDTLNHLTNNFFLFRWLLISLLILCCWRLVLRSLLIFASKNGFNTRKVAIAGCNKTAIMLANKMAENKWLGLQLHGIYNNTPCELTTLTGNIDALVTAAISGKIEQVYISMAASQEGEIKALVDALSNSTATVFIVPDLFTFELMNSRQISIAGIPAISIYDSPFTFSDTIVKRGFDIVGSLGILCVIGIPMLFIAAAVKLTSPGPAIFRQLRYGLDGKAINVWKFRSMTVEENGRDIKQATKNDSRLTCIGGLLRHTSLDELPQFFNVLQGSMSIVGPRPHAIAHNEEYRELINGYMLRHKVKPGITGWAQINGWRGETDTMEKMEKRIEYDLYYVRNWDIWLDIKIIFLTALKGFIDKNAY